MRHNWDDAAPPPRSNAQPMPRHASQAGGGMPMPPRSTVPPARPNTYAHYEQATPKQEPMPPQNQPRDEQILRRVDGTPISTRGRLERPRPARRALPEQQQQQHVTAEVRIERTAYAPALSPYDADVVIEMPKSPKPTYTPPRAAAPQPTSVSPIHQPSAPIRQGLPTRQAPPSISSTVPPRPERQEQRSISEAVPPMPTEEQILLSPGMCPACRGAGYLRLEVPIGHPAFGRAVPCTCKEEQLAQRRRVELWKLSSLDAFQEMTFDRFNMTVPGTREAWEAAKRYAADPDGWLVLSGSCGSGKTHLAAAIANMQLELGTLVLFNVVPHLLDHLRSAFAPHSETTYDALFEKVCQAGLLVLDDLGAEHSTPWAQEKLFQIINHRYMYRYPTVITTNLELINDLDDRVRSRLTDIGLVRHVRVEATDYRPHHVPPRRTARPLR